MDILKKKITQAFKLSGYVIRSENSTFLAEQLLPFDASEHEKWLTTVIENIQNLKLNSANIDRTIIEKAICEINRVGLQENETVFSIIDAFDIPRFVYNTIRKKFELDKKPRSMISNPAMQVGHLRQRYDMLYQKTIRHELFSPSIIQKTNGEDTNKFKLLHAENLLASSEVKEAVILGQLNQIVEGKFYIEDPTGYVEVDLSEARYHAGFFCEGSFVLAEGSYENKVLKVDGLGFPPAEPASSSRAFFGTANTWGGPSEKLLKYSVALQEAERTNTEATMVFLSDVQLDLPQVLEKLRKLFVGYDSCPPVCIVLMGPFSTTTHNFYDVVPLFKKLAEAAYGCDQLKKETDLIIVPHANDPIASDIFPRQSMPDTICEDLLKAWPRTKLASNPCRLQYCTQQIVVFRFDLMARLSRNAIKFPGTKNIDNHYARTLICQGHLTPLGRFLSPTYWDYDSSMWLYPLPDLLVIGDSCQSFNISQHGCTILNTGSFPKSNFSFKMYIPHSKTIEDSEIPEGYGEDGDKEEENTTVSYKSVDYIQNRVIFDTGITESVTKSKDKKNKAKIALKKSKPSGITKEIAMSLIDEELSADLEKIEIAQNTVDDIEMPHESELTEEVLSNIVDDSELPEAPSNLEQNIDISGGSSRPKVTNDDDDIPGVSGLSREEIMDSLTEEEREQVRLVQQLQLPSESDSDSDIY